MYNYNYLKGDYQMDRNNNINSFNNNDFMDFIFGQNQSNSNDINNPNNTDVNNSLELYTPEEGYQKGNSFSNLYSEYKNYKPANLVAKNDQAKLLLEMSQMAFAAHELNLYLDLNPGDNSILALFNDYRRRAMSLKEEYENRYGPISINSDVLVNSPFLWEEMAWPWEGGIL